jgi:hypothetical protein
LITPPCSLEHDESSGCRVDREMVGGECVDTKWIRVVEQRQDVVDPPPHVGLAHRAPMLAAVY